MIKHALLKAALAVAVGGLGLLGTPSAQADCTVNVGFCDGGSCTVNVSNCGPTCSTTVNLGQCSTNNFDPIGRRCRFVSNTDVSAEPDTQTGEQDAGPLIISAAAEVQCRIYVNGVEKARTAMHTADAGPAHVGAVAGQVAYHSVPGDVVAQCTVVQYDSGTTEWYHAGTTTAGTGYWKVATLTDPLVPGQCAQAITIDVNPQVCPVLLAIDSRIHDTTLEDTWQDCGPYSPII